MPQEINKLHKQWLTAIVVCSLLTGALNYALTIAPVKKGSSIINKPATSIDMNTVDDLFKTPSKEVFISYANGAPDELKPKNKNQ